MQTLEGRRCLDREELRKEVGVAGGSLGGDRGAREEDRSRAWCRGNCISDLLPGDNVTHHLATARKLLLSHRFLGGESRLAQLSTSASDSQEVGAAVSTEGGSVPLGLCAHSGSLGRIQLGSKA